MIFGPAKTTHDAIVELLAQSPLTATQLQQRIRPQVTLQAVYKALRELISFDIVLKQKQDYSLSNLWRQKVEVILLQRKSLRLAQGEQVVYKFRKLEHLDAFWKHSIHDIFDELGTFPVFGYSPHQYWSFVPGRAQSEQEYHREFTDKKQFLFSVIGDDTILDKEFKKENSTPFVEVFLCPDHPFGRRIHHLIIGSHIVTVQISKQLSDEIDALYPASKTRQELADHLLGIFKKPGAITMSVEHDTRKAARLRKQLSKHFHIPREIREKYELF
jgi:hypothetical protein